MDPKAVDDDLSEMTPMLLDDELALSAQMTGQETIAVLKQDGSNGCMAP